MPARTPRTTRKSRRARERAEKYAEQKLAGWQRKLIWAVWLAFLGLAALDSARDSFSGREFLAMFAAVGVTVWCVRQPRGGAKVEWEKPEQLEGEFSVRTNWALVLTGAILTLGGVAGGMRIIDDLRRGFATMGAVLEDMGVFLIKLFESLYLDPIYTEVTEGSRMYILVFLLIPGGLLLFFSLWPFWHRGVPFHLEGGDLYVWREGAWQGVEARSYRVVRANGTNVFFDEPEGDVQRIELAQERVFSEELGTQVPDYVLAAYFREYVKKRGFRIVSEPPAGTPVKKQSSWRAERGNA
jgi:hypothetical protein